MRFDELERKVDKLKSLLADRHPGLITWMIALERAIDEVTACAGWVCPICKNKSYEEQVRDAVLHGPHIVKDPSPTHESYKGRI